ncbi:MAG: FAD-dependent oxidoreductase, partial [Pseudomonadota bacterium]
MKKNRILIVGGVAGGASCATRARRLCEQCEIVLFDKGPYVSFANCGLPYLVGDVIGSEEHLLVATPQSFKERFNIAVRTDTEVTRIDRAGKTIEVRDIKSGEVRQEAYEKLVLATGAIPIRPPLEGIDLAGIHVLRTIPVSRKIRTATAEASKALIVGGGFIGLEMAENLARIGLSVSLIELADQVLPPLDPEMAAWVEQRLRANRIDLHLGEGVAAFRRRGSAIVAHTDRGNEIRTDIVILGIGVKPESTLARQAGLTLGKRGGIRVDEFMRTSDPHIWAVGDVVEVKNRITGHWQVTPLAGPANRQGRIAATAIIRGAGDHNPLRFHGVLGTAVCGVFGLTVATTGA